MPDLGRIELHVRPSPPFGEWISALRLMGYLAVGLEMAEGEAVAFQSEAGEGLRCFLRTPSDALPWVDSCGLTEATKRRKPPELLVVRTSDPVKEIDAYLGAHPNRVAALELSLTDVREAYESASGKTFEWSSGLARATSSRGIPVLLSSSAKSPTQLASPFTKGAFSSIMRTGRRSTAVRERKFLRRLDQAVATRRVGPP